MRTENTDSVYNKMKRCIEKYSMLKPGESVIACVSGGCDSVALLLLLQRFVQEKKGEISLLCAHFDHMLRGGESDGDRLYVQALCEKRGIPFYCERQDAAAYAKCAGISLEEGAREIRYRFFFHLAERYNAKIAVAHNRNDRIETVLQNIARGTGIYGLKGISYVRNNIIRPLLDVGRPELEEVCHTAGIAYREDSTNGKPFCNRNRIRLEVLPYLRSHLAQDLDDKLYRLSVLAARDSELLEGQAARHYAELVRRKGEILVIEDPERFSALHEALQSRVVRLILQEFFPGGKGLHLTMIENLRIFLAEHQVGTRTEVAGGIAARAYHDGIQIGRNTSAPQEKERICKNGNVECKNCSPREAMKISAIEGNFAEAFDRDGLEEFCRRHGCSWEVRYRREGDFFHPYGAAGGKRLKKFFIDRKIPAHLRDRIPLLACGGEILWVCGIMRSQVALISNETENAVIFKYNL